MKPGLILALLAGPIALTLFPMPLPSLIILGLLLGTAGAALDVYLERR